MREPMPAGSLCARERTAAVRIALLSPYWGGNLGDGAILQATMDNLRSLRPDASSAGIQFVGITMNPEGVLRHHGIGGAPLVSFRRAYYSVAAPTPAASDIRRRWTAEGRLSIFGRAKLYLAERFSSTYELARRLRTALAAIPAELWHFLKAAHFLRQADMLLVAGGGQLDDEWGGAWGHPYALYKWALAARLAGRPVAFLSVGVCRLATPLSRWFVARALALSSMVSLRDPWSQSFVQHALGRPAYPVLPDLALGLPLDSAAVPARPGEALTTIGISPIAYGRRGWPTRDDASSDQYLQVLARFIERKLEAGNEIILFHTDSPDKSVVDLLAERVRSRISHPLTARLRISATDSLAALRALLPSLQAVIASRLHGVILSHLHAIPTLAISYDRKVESHMAQVGHERLCLQLRGLDLDELDARFAELQARSPLLRRELGEKVSRWRDALRPQFESILRRAERKRIGE